MTREFFDDARTRLAESETLAAMRAAAGTALPLDRFLPRVHRVLREMEREAVITELYRRVETNAPDAERCRAILREWRLRLKHQQLKGIEEWLRR